MGFPQGPGTYTYRSCYWVSTVLLQIHFTGLTFGRRANDNSNDVTLETFTSNLSAFADKLRIQYPKQPIFVFSPWGWANGDGVSPFYIYYESAYSGVVKQKCVVDSAWCGQKLT